MSFLTKVDLIFQLLLNVFVLVNLITALPDVQIPIIVDQHLNHLNLTTLC